MSSRTGSAETSFFGLATLGEMPPDLAAEKLLEVGDTEAAAAIRAAMLETEKRVSHFSLLQHLWGGTPKPYQHTAHAFGFIRAGRARRKDIPISSASEIEPEQKLQGKRITVTLDCLRVAEYPGHGEHRVLFDFYACNQLPDRQEDLHFNATYRVQDGERAAILGYPLFVGLHVGAQGLALRCFTVNVMNADDEAFLQFMDSDTFRSGLKLVSVLQPAIVPLTAMASGITKAIASRHRNVPVQEFHLGLDFSRVRTRARLASGSYVAVQIPETFKRGWDWEEWVYDESSGQIVSRADHSVLIPFNYVVIGISEFSG